MRDAIAYEQGRLSVAALRQLLDAWEIDEAYRPEWPGQGKAAWFRRIRAALDVSG